MRTAPTAATEVLLGLFPVLRPDKRIYILYCSDDWKPKSVVYGDAYMSQGLTYGRGLAK
jgi:hypothetical protein